MKTVIGIDVSKRFVDVAIPCEGRKPFRVKHYPHNDLTTAEAILADLPTQEVHVVLEATGTYSLQLATSFYEAGIAISLVNPLCIKHFAKMRLKRAKTDRYDARTIAQYGQVEQPSLWRPRPPQQEQLRQVVKAIEDLHILKTELTNRQESAVPLPIQSPVCQAVHQQLVDALEQQLTVLKAEMERLAKQVSGETYALLTSIKGIGEASAGAIMAYYGSFETFDTAGQAVAFAGLNPQPYESGTSVRGRGSISKKGHSTIRRLLYMGALSAMRYNPSCKALYERMLAKGKPKRVARVAVAHKLLRMAFGVVKGGRPFDPYYSKS